LSVIIATQKLSGKASCKTPLHSKKAKKNVFHNIDVLNVLFMGVYTKVCIMVCFGIIEVFSAMCIGLTFVISFKDFVNSGK
jgi:hypothetical protein